MEQGATPICQESDVRIVFEGDAPADLSRNPLLGPKLDAPAWPPSPRSAQAWLGDAVAIKDPTSALFRRQGGNKAIQKGGPHTERDEGEHVWAALDERVPGSRKKRRAATENDRRCQEQLHPVHPWAVQI